VNEYLEREYINLEEKLGFYFSRIISYPLLAPEHVYFSLTNRCNLQCKMCDIYKSFGRKEDELTTFQIKDIICQIKDMGIKHLIFSGGEPLLRDDLIEIIEFATAKGISSVDIISNGTLFEDNIIQDLIQAGLNHITVSLDGIGEVNDQIRGKGVFEKAVANIDRINYYKEKYRSKSPTVGINFTIMDNNIDEIIPVIKFARDKGCNILVLQPLLFNNTKMFEKKRNSLWPKEKNISKLREVLEEVKKLKYNLNDFFVYTDTSILDALPRYFKGKRMPPHFKCYEAIKRIVITCDGKVWSCVGIYGDLKQEKLEEIWFSKEAYKIRQKVKECRQHCLQDCIYFPSNIFEEISYFFKKIPREESIMFQNRLMEKTEYYMNKHLLFAEGNFSKRLTAFKIRRKIKGALRKVYKG
jgi:MoaA/NifB/PqqE/SkfB family radical SAM enzyme